MQGTLRRLLAALCVFALFAVACQSSTTVERVEDGRSSEAPTATPEPDANAPVAAATSTPTPVPSTVFDGVAPAPFVVPSQWEEPFALEEGVLEGHLPNGLRYVVRSNDRPGGQAQLRLVVHAGSIHEEPGSEGVAHFLEHMMFNGTERFPGNEIVQVLEGFGSGFGPDVNAYTSFEETVYELELPTRSTETLQLGIDVLHEWATAATITDEAVIAERGVVREEHRRATQTLAGRRGAFTREVLLSGTPHKDRVPIGDADVIDQMSSEQVRAFYEKWYRPEFMTVVAVGDFDEYDVQQRIANTFFSEPTNDVSQPALDTTSPGPFAEPVFDVFSDSEIQRSEVAVFWRLDNPAPTSPANVRRGLVGSLALSMLNTRLFEREQSGESAFLSGGASVGGYTAGLQLVSVSGRAEPENIEASLTELLSEIERARQFGFDPGELDRASASARASIDQQFAEASTRQDSSFAAAFVDFSLGRGAVPDATEARDIGIELLDSITLDDVQGFLFETLATDPYVLVTTPDSAVATVPSPEELADIYDGVVGQVATEVARVGGDQVELMARPEPAAVVEEQRLDGLATTVVTYENGARLAYRQTRITENLVQMRGVSRGGFFSVSEELAPMLGSASALVSGSGFETVDAVALDRIIADSIVSLSTSVGRATEGLTGDASTDDLETLMQLTHLSMTEPIITDLRVRQFVEGWMPLSQDPTIRPSIAASLELWRLRYGDTPWFRYLPTVADLDDLDPEALLAAHKERFADAGDFVFIVVGDFDPDELVDLGARYLGTLPDAGRRDERIDRDPGLPTENLVATVQAGVGDQGSLKINWESPFPLTLEAEVTARVLEVVVNARLRDLIREELGASYAPSAEVTLLTEPKTWVDTIIEVESDPERVAEVSEAVRAELARIRAGEFDERYVTLAIDQLSESYRFFSNREWMDLIEFHLLNPERPEGEYRDRSALAATVTVADVAEMAQIVFPADQSVEVRLVPAG